VTPAEATRGIDLYALTGLVSDDGKQRVVGPQRDFGGEGTADPRLDSMIVQRAKGWAETLRASPVQGIQLDPTGRLFVVAGQDAEAKRQFATRLASPGLSLEDRAYTILLAIGAFTDKPQDTTRLSTAQGYLAQIDALPSKQVALAQFTGHVAVANAYYILGNTGVVTTQLSKAFSVVPDIPFAQRTWDMAMMGSVGQAFVTFADVLSAQPQGRATVDSVGKWLLQYTKAPQEVRARDTQDSLAVRLQEFQTITFTNVLKLVAYLGRPAPPIVANYWFNMQTPATTVADVPGAASLSLDDGNIHIVEFGKHGCTGCVVALPKLAALQQSLPKPVSIIYVTLGGDSWGATPCTPEEAASHFKHYYTVQKDVHLPIALWIGTRQNDADGGTIETGSPTFGAYHIDGTPWFFVTDRKGIVRHASFGYNEPLLRGALMHLFSEKQ